MFRFARINDDPTEISIIPHHIRRLQTFKPQGDSPRPIITSPPQGKLALSLFEQRLDILPGPVQASREDSKTHALHTLEQGYKLDGPRLPHDRIRRPLSNRLLVRRDRDIVEADVAQHLYHFVKVEVKMSSHDLDALPHERAPLLDIAIFRHGVVVAAHVGGEFVDFKISAWAAMPNVAKFSQLFHPDLNDSRHEVFSCCITTNREAVLCRRGGAVGGLLLTYTPAQSTS